MRWGAESCVVGEFLAPQSASVVVRRTSIVIQKMGSWMVLKMMYRC